jgi:hypothetical protein
MPNTAPLLLACAALVRAPATGSARAPAARTPAAPEPALDTAAALTELDRALDALPANQQLEIDAGQRGWNDHEQADWNKAAK